MTPTLSPMIATTTPITPSGLRPEPSGLRPEPSASDVRKSIPTSLALRTVPPIFAATAMMMAAVAHRAVSRAERAVMSTRKPLTAKKTGAKNDAVTISIRSRTCGS